MVEDLAERDGIRTLEWLPTAAGFKSCCLASGDLSSYMFFDQTGLGTLLLESLSTAGPAC